MVLYRRDKNFPKKFPTVFGVVNFVDTSMGMLGCNRNVYWIKEKNMVALALIGVIIMSGLVGWGVWTIVKSVSLKKTTDRYRYVKAKDENGNEITKVIDLNDENK